MADAPVTPASYAIRTDDSFDALLSSHAGASRPAYAVQGTVWLDTATGELFLYDGTNDVKLLPERTITPTALADADAALSASQLLGGLITITPTAVRSLTVDNAAPTLTAMGTTADGSNFEFTVVNTAAFDVTLLPGTGVTTVGSMVVNNASATFMFYRTSATTGSLVRK